MLFHQKPPCDCFGHWQVAVVVQFARRKLIYLKIAALSENSKQYFEVLFQSKS